MCIETFHSIQPGADERFGHHRSQVYRQPREGQVVWLDGKRIDDGPSHPAFPEIINEPAHIYDLQHSGEFQDVMTFLSPSRAIIAASLGC